MGDVKLKVVGDASGALRENAKLEQQIDKLKGKVKSLTGATRTSSEAGRRGFRGIASSAMGAAAGVVSVAAAVAIAKKAYTILKEEVEATAAAGEKMISKLQKGVALSGDIANYGKITKRLREMQGVAFLDQGQRGDIYAGVRGSLPTAPLEKVMSLTKQAALSVAISGDVPTGVQFGSVLGDLSKMMPGKSADDLSDIATVAQQAAGRFGEQLDTRGSKGMMQFSQLGLSGEEAVAMFLASAEKGQGAMGVTALASWIEQEQKKHPRTSVQDIISRGTGAKGKRAPPAAVQAILAGYAEKDYTGMLAEAQTGDLFESQIATAQANPDIRRKLAAMAGTAGESLTEYDARALPMTMESAGKFMAASTRAQGMDPISRWVRKNITYPIAKVYHDDPADAVRGGWNASAESVRAMQYQAERPGASIEESYARTGGFTKGAEIHAQGAALEAAVRRGVQEGSASGRLAPDVQAGDLARKQLGR